MNDNIDYSFYDRIPVLTTEVAACLWADIDPAERYGSLPPLIKNLILLFEQEIGNHVHYKGITKQELCRLAERLDSRPYFLFHDEVQDDER
jgi:hypothetical protein